MSKRFFYLRKTCYRGMLRYDKNGGFNPFGNYQKVDFSSLLAQIRSLLRNTSIYNESFEFIFDKFNANNNFFFQTLLMIVLSIIIMVVLLTKKTINFCEKFSTTKNKCLLILNKTDFTVNLYKDYIFDEYEKRYSFKLSEKCHRINI